MRASELIVTLQELVGKHGDQDVRIGSIADAEAQEAPLAGVACSMDEKDGKEFCTGYLLGDWELMDAFSGHDDEDDEEEP